METTSDLNRNWFGNHHWIDGLKVEANPLATGYHAVNPADGQRFGPEFFDATSQQLKQASQAANRAFGWARATSTFERAEWLRRIAAKIEDQRETLQQIAHLETGFPLQRLNGEITRICKQALDFALWIEKGAGLTASHYEGGARLELSHQPMGPVAVFGASNFPFACSVFGGDTCAALAMGCPVIFKAHPAHPNTSQAVAGCIVEALNELHCPGGLFHMLHGREPEISRQLVMDPFICAVAFTGSREVGVQLYRLAAQRLIPIPFFGELGSVNPLFIHPDSYSAIDNFAVKLAAAFMMGYGQFCTNPGIWLVLKGVETDTWLKLVQHRLGEIPTSPLLTERIRDRYLGQLNSIENRSDVDVWKAVNDSLNPNGFHVQPALAKISFQDFVKGPECDMWDEVFGPFAWVVECESMDQMFSLIPKMPGQLSSAVFGTESYWSHQRKNLSQLESKVGRLLFNDFPPGLEVAWALHHGGPFPASTHSDTTSIGLNSVRRFVRPFCKQTCK